MSDAVDLLKNNKAARIVVIGAPGVGCAGRRS